MDLNQIKYFLNLADALNFTQAARQSGISQPSLTKSIQRLEDELGAPLVYRDGKDTRLTALGRDMQTAFMRVDAQIEAARELAETSVAGHRRMLSVGVGATISPNVLAGFFGLVIEQLPSVTLEIHQMLPGENENEVLSGKYDLCVLPEPPASNFKLVSTPLFSERIMIGLGQGHLLAVQQSLTPEQIMDEVYIDRLHCEFRTQLVQHFMDRDIVMRPRLQSEREDWVQHLVAAGMGVCALPERSAIVGDLAVRPLDGLDLTRQVTLVAVSGSGNARETRQIVDLARGFDWSDPG